MRADPARRGMRLGLFIALFMALLVVLALSVPVPGDFPRHAGAASFERAPAPTCLRLSYEPVEAGRWLPSHASLTDSSAREYSRPGLPSSRAIFGFGAEFDERGGWRPAGRDSFDLVWYHSPVLRLPARGDTLVGRGDWGAYPSLFDALLWSRPFTVRAIREPCASRS